ncbi:MAG: glucosaminidase domain-containing protein [Rubrobacter sp.]|nr:glucosaminidase domain-containing protein [Rubrobacter sp.]
MNNDEAFHRPGDRKSASLRDGFKTLSVLSVAVVLAALVAFAVVSFGAASPAESAPYAMAVDNGNPNRFSAPAGWANSAAFPRQRLGANYAYATPGSGEAARFKVRAPATGPYAVFARWPAGRGHNASTPIGVVTTTGTKWVRVNQRVNGGRWVRLGSFRLAAGDDFKTIFARNGNGGGRVVADAVRIARINPDPTRNPDAILGRPIHSQAKVANYARSKGATTYIMQTIPHYYNLGPRVGIAPDFLVAQAMVETGYGRYGGDSRPWNMAGIKKGGNVGDEPRDFERPATAYEGVRMHVNHMAAYTNRPTIGTPHARYYDARSAQSGRGYWVTRISQLGGGVWATDPNYAPKIRRILNEM